jgi:hypothetical protein
MRTPASFARLIRFDRTGTGASDPLSLGRYHQLRLERVGPTAARSTCPRPAQRRAVNPNRSHRIIVNSSLADGGDNFTVLTQAPTV